MPVIGIILGAFSFLAAPTPDKSTFLEDLDESISFKRSKNNSFLRFDDFTDESPIAKEEHYSLILLRSLDVQPIQDILTGKNAAHKRNALSKIAKNPDKRSIKLLRSCLLDENPDIRFYASSALSRIEEDLNNILTLIKQDIEQHPTRNNLIINLVDHYLKMVDLKILPAATEDFYLKNALELLTNQDDNETFRLRKVKILSLLKRDKEALQLIENDDGLSLELNIVKCESLLRLNQFHELSTLCSSIKYIESIENDTIRESLKYWMKIDDNQSRATAT